MSTGHREERINMLTETTAELLKSIAMHQLN